MFVEIAIGYENKFRYTGTSLSLWMFTLNRHLLNRFFLHLLQHGKRKEKYKQKLFYARERISNSKSFTLQKDTTFLLSHHKQLLKSTLFHFFNAERERKMCLKRLEKGAINTCRFSYSRLAKEF
jgi:hypothetical protein